MNETEKILLAFLFLKGVPVKKNFLLKSFSLSENDLTNAINALVVFSQKNLPFSILETNDDYELTLNTEMTTLFDPYIKKERESDITPSTMQALTIIAYLGKASKFEVSFIRGVSATQSISTLLSKGLIDESLDGTTYSLTTLALSHLGITKKEDLPSYDEIRNGFLEKMKDALA